MTDALLATLGNLIAALGNVGAAGVLRERIALINTQFELLKERVIELEKERAQLVTRTTEQEQQLARYHLLTEYVEEAGALFRRRETGGYCETPYCPVCHSAMTSFQKTFNYECGNPDCGRLANFTGRTLLATMAKLP